MISILDFDIDSISYVELRLLKAQVDIILRALELYSYTFNFVASPEINDLEDLRAGLIFHTYHEILTSYPNNVFTRSDSVKEVKRKLEYKKRKIYNNRKFG